MPLKLPKHYSDGSLENLLRPSGLQAMNAQQQYQELVSMRAQTAQMNREDDFDMNRKPRKKKMQERIWRLCQHVLRNRSPSRPTRKVLGFASILRRQ